MPKNIIFLYGMLDENRRYIHESVIPGKENVNKDNIYVTLNSLTMALSLEGEIGIRKFFENTLKVKKRMAEYHKNIINYNIKRTLNENEYNKNMLITKSVSEVLLNNWLEFLYQNKERLSISKSLIRKSAKDSIKGDYKSRFFNKNLSNSPPNIKVNGYTEFDDNSYIYCLKNPDKNRISPIDKAFDTFISQGDKEGFRFLVDLDTTVTIYTNKNENNYIIKSFISAFLRKASKLTLDWLNEEIKNPRSFINGMRFITDYISENNDNYYADTLDNVHPFNPSHHSYQLGYSKKDELTYLDASNNFYPITFSEYRHFNKNDYSKENINMTTVNININEVVKAKINKSTQDKKAKVLAKRIKNYNA
ncbi:hypothetical protein ID853_10180 [Xenorhabdus sp. Vera]|uniref:hypothetical protein n=1 Tax=Xenorhabdus koppenhoeferi TaxID=351659 RepID=UPI0019B42D3D|nr:hypothetical protein [Xenorhabdus sp. Vera]MBD2811239.1 hypothetical protein [Xenorhabdus sp. Vera]